MRAIKENPCQFEHPRCGAGHLNICDICYLRSIEEKEIIQDLLDEINVYIEKLQDVQINSDNQRDVDWNGKAYRNGKIHALQEIREFLRREE